MNRPGVELEAPLNNIDLEKYYLINLVFIRIPIAIVGIPPYSDTSMKTFLRHTYYNALVGLRMRK